MKKNILIDIDGTVSEDIPNEESHRFADAKMIDNAVEYVNKLYDDGNTVTFFTARQEKHRAVTTEWLDKHGFKYNGLIMDKPRGGNYIWIDNLQVNGVLYNNNWNRVCSNLMNNKDKIEKQLNNTSTINYN